MFGYVRISKEALDEESFKLFRAYYCGLCKKIGKSSQIARLGLSYDMTFLLVLLSAISKEEPQIKSCRCIMHPLKKREVVCNFQSLCYVADMSILLCYKKLEDDLNDEKSIASFFGRLFYRRAAEKIEKKYSKKSRFIEDELSKLSELEKNNCASSDEVADCFAKVCEEIFVPDFIEDENTKKALGWLGYNIGRWIYLIDAIDDLKKDAKTNSYNPFLKRFLSLGREQLVKELEVTLIYTLANITAAYDILKIRRNDNILKNIIYIGLKGVQDRILNNQEEKNGSL